MAAVASRPYNTNTNGTRGYGPRRTAGWDEEVVPALRKRLENESRTLDRRISLTVEEQNQEDLARSVSPRPVVAPPSRIPAPRKSGTYSHSNGSAPLLSASPALRNEPSQNSIILTPPVQRILTTEPAPFPPSSHKRRASASSVASSSASSSHQQMPFEHWYRGDTSRNGGVGELRVGRRQEMLDIANYGHTMEQRREREAEVAEGKRRRAGSVNALDRSSFYMDESSSRSHVADEEMPDGLDVDEYDEWDERYRDPSVVNPHYYDQDSIATGSPSNDRTTTPTPAMRSPMTRAGSEPPQAFPSHRPNGKTPASPKAATLNSRDPRKNTRLAASQATRQRVESTRKIEKENQERRSVAMYELDPDITPESIPQFTTHSPPTGKWDDVILPAVARKKGLTPSSTPLQQRLNEPLTSPSDLPSQHPGDPSSTIIGSSLQTRHDHNFEMSEFGQPQQYSSNPHDARPIPTMRQPQQDYAEAPFAEYAPPAPLPEPRVQQTGHQTQQLPRPMTVFAPAGTDVEKAEKEKKRDGCCCVIM